MMQEKSTITTRKYLKRFRKTPYPQKRVMSEQDRNSNGDIVKDFQSSGRTGRRNALGDVLGAHKEVSTSELPLKLEKLTTNDVPSSSEISTTKQNNYDDVENENTSTNVNSSSSTTG